MNTRSWKLFVVGIGMLLICLSPTLAKSGSVDLPTFVGGILVSLIGLVLLYRKRK